MSDRVPSPCIRRCCLDEASGLCVGCKRSLDEITAWSMLSEVEKRAILALLPKRGGTAPTQAAFDLSTD